MVSIIEIGNNNRNLVFAEILRQPTVSRSAIAEILDLNNASVSRITRDLLDAKLIREVELSENGKRPGRRFIGLAPNGAGGYVIGIGLNAFRQSVTLANLENEKISEWVSPSPPGPDGEDFICHCLGKAREMLDEHVPDRQIFFGVGMAVAADLDLEQGRINSAPGFHWTKQIDVRQLTAELLDAPLVLDTPSSAINQSEAAFGLGKGYSQITTLHCSIGFGLGVKKSDDQRRATVDFSRVMTRARTSDTERRPLNELCGGLGVLLDAVGPEKIAGLTDLQRGQTLTELVARSATDPALQKILHQKGKLSAAHLSLLFDVIRPELLLLAGPLALSTAYAEGFRKELALALSESGPLPKVAISEMTPTGASRWLSLKANVAFGNLDLVALKERSAA